MKTETSPIPNVCKTYETGKCHKCVARDKTKCEDFKPIYSWEEIGYHNTCPVCRGPCDQFGCQSCNPEGYAKKLEETCKNIDFS
jgi:hypothetical protein